MGHPRTRVPPLLAHRFMEARMDGRKEMRDGDLPEEEEEEEGNDVLMGEMGDPVLADARE